MQIVRFLLFLLITPLSFSKERTLVYAPEIPQPTLSEIRYGKHERNLLDFWKATSRKPTPLVFGIHGGGWIGGSKERLSRFGDINLLLQAGISVVAINYRFVTDLESPPVKAPLHDAARVLQFVRSKAKEWNIDKSRAGAAGGSSGPCSSLWLSFHNNLANPNSKDSVERESTRLSCAAVIGAQTTLDPEQMKEWTPNSKYGGHAFGLRNFTEFLAKRDKIMPWIKEYSPYGTVSPNAPPHLSDLLDASRIGQGTEKSDSHFQFWGKASREWQIQGGRYPVNWSIPAPQKSVS